MPAVSGRTASGEDPAPASLAVRTAAILGLRLAIVKRRERDPVGRREPWDRCGGLWPSIRVESRPGARRSSAGSGWVPRARRQASLTCWAETKLDSFSSAITRP